MVRVQVVPASLKAELTKQLKLWEKKEKIELDREALHLVQKLTYPTLKKVTGAAVVKVALKNRTSTQTSIPAMLWPIGAGAASSMALASHGHSEPFSPRLRQGRRLAAPITDRKT